MSHCDSCQRETPSAFFVPYCARNPLGTADVTAEEHGNIIDNTVTCETDYCNPDEMTLEEFYRQAGKDANPQTIMERCTVCSCLKPGRAEEPVQKRTQAEEMALAAKENRQPNCVYCRHPIQKVAEEQYDDITWIWNAETRKYEKETEDDSDQPYHECSECPDGCHVHDPDFTENKLIYY
jgi:hypothetical protein